MLKISIAGGTMLNYTELRNIQRKEMESSEVTQLDGNFYAKIAEFLAAKKKEAQNSKSLLTIREYENIHRIVMAIQSRREEKIVLMAVRGNYEARGLTVEEEIMLKELASIIEKSRSMVKDALERERIAPATIRVKMLRNVEQYRGKDDFLYGPFANGEERLLPLEEAKWLLQVGMAAEI